jgi:Fe-S cluster biosynthesis and repair protein YggX
VAESRLLSCSRCGRTAAGLAKPPLAGDVGKLVFEHVCESCWGEWFEQSINVINHQGLNPALPEDRKQLYDVMKEFFDL